MFEFLKKKLGLSKIEQDIYIMQDEIEELNSKVYESIALIGMVSAQLDKLKNTSEPEVIEQLNEIKILISNIPKQMTIKNVLGVC